MLNLISAHPLPFIIALVIGVATGWWIWANRSHEDAYEDGEPVEPYQVDPEPVPEADAEPATLAASAAAGAGAGAAAAALADSGDAAKGDKPKIAAAVGEPDDLTRIKGIGPQLNNLCLSLGVSRFDQIAKWTASDVAEVDKYLKIKGRIDRDDWVGQAKILAGGRTVPDGKPNIAAAVGDPDDLKRIKGIGPKLEKLCNSLGVMRFDQISQWTARDVAAVDEHLGSFKGRITRDQWVDQAKLLADGRVTEHVSKYGA